MSKKRQRSRRQTVDFPSAYRYMALGLLLPIFVVVGTIVGYSYGMTLGGFYEWVLPVLGSMVGLGVATVIIVRITLLWDKRILRALKKSKPDRRKKS